MYCVAEQQAASLQGLCYMYLWKKKKENNVSARVQQVFQKSNSQLQILSPRNVIRSKLHSEDPKFCSGLWTPLSSVVFFSVHINWYVLLYVFFLLYLYPRSDLDL